MENQNNPIVFLSAFAPQSFVIYEYDPGNMVRQILVLINRIGSCSCTWHYWLSSIMACYLLQLLNQHMLYPASKLLFFPSRDITTSRA